MRRVPDPLPCHQWVPAAVRVAVGATFDHRAVRVSAREAPPASVAVMVTGSVVSSPRVAVHDHVPRPRVTVPAVAVAQTGGPAAPSVQVPTSVSALPSGATAGPPLSASRGPVLTAMALMTSIRRVVTRAALEA